jgi:hypothetical protein
VVVVGSRERCGKNRKAVPDWINVMGKGSNIHLCSSLSSPRTCIIFIHAKACVCHDRSFEGQTMTSCRSPGRAYKLGIIYIDREHRFPTCTAHLMSRCFSWSNRRVMALRTISLFHLLGRYSFALITTCIHLTNYTYDAQMVS